MIVGNAEDGEPIGSLACDQPGLLALRDDVAEETFADRTNYAHLTDRI